MGCKGGKARDTRGGQPPAELPAWQSRELGLGSSWQCSRVLFGRVGLGQGEQRAAARAAAGISAVVPAGLKASVVAVCSLTCTATERRTLSSWQEERWAAGVVCAGKTDFLCLPPQAGVQPQV